MNYSEEMKLDEVRKGEREDQSLSVQFSHSVMSDSLRPHGRSTPGLPVHPQHLEFIQTHVH